MLLRWAPTYLTSSFSLESPILPRIQLITSLIFSGLLTIDFLYLFCKCRKVNLFFRNRYRIFVKSNLEQMLRLFKYSRMSTLKMQAKASKRPVKKFGTAWSRKKLLYHGVMPEWPESQINPEISSHPRRISNLKKLIAYVKQNYQWQRGGANYFGPIKGIFRKVPKIGNKPTNSLYPIKYAGGKSTVFYKKL